VKEEKIRKSVTVVSACIMRPGGKEILLSMRRAPGVPGLHEKWELPGGKIEFGETPEQAIVREIREELGITVVPRRMLPYLHTNLWEYEHAIQHVVLACYECDLQEDLLFGPPQDAKWFRIGDIDFELTLPGTREFVSLVANHEEFDEVCIQFEHVNPSGNITNQFTVATQPTLYSHYGLVKYWGRTGQWSRMRIEEYPSPKELDERIFETAKQRLAHGYHIRALQGPRHYRVLLRIVELAKQRNERCPDPIFS
jgi:8-oxo-dGTP diphosphatase